MCDENRFRIMNVLERKLAQEKFFCTRVVKVNSCRQELADNEQQEPGQWRGAIEGLIQFKFPSAARATTALANRVYLAKNKATANKIDQQASCLGARLITEIFTWLEAQIFPGRYPTAANFFWIFLYIHLGTAFNWVSSFVLRNLRVLVVHVACQSIIGCSPMR